MTSLPLASPPDAASQDNACSRCGLPFSGSVRFCTSCGTASPLAIANAEGGDGDDASPEPAANSPAVRLAPARAAGTLTRTARLRVEEALAKSPVFSLLPPAARTELAASCFRRRYEPGQWLVLEGQAATRGFVVASGEARAYVGAGHGRRVLVRACHPGDFLGEPAPTDGPVRSVAVQAVTPVETYVFASERLFELAQNYAIFREALEHHLTTARIEVFLRRASPFAPLPPDVLMALAGRMEAVPYDANATVFSEGDEGDAFYIVRHGSVNVIAGGTQVATLRAGDCFGEAALLTGAPRTATIRADEPTGVLRLDRADFDRINAEYEEVRGFFIELLRRRDLLTPRLARSTGLTAPPLTSAAEAAAKVDYRPVRTGVALAAGLSALMLVLALTARGGYLLGPSLLSAAAVAPLAAAFFAGATGITRDIRPVRLAIIVLVSGLAGLLVLQLRGAVDALESPVVRESVTALLGVLAQTALLVVLSRRRGFRLEMDGLVAGATAGWGFGIASLLTTVLNAQGAGETLKAAAWVNILLLPALYGLLCANLGAAVWEARESQRYRPFAGAFVFAAVLTLVAGLTSALAVPLIFGVPILIAVTGIALLTVRRRLRPAIVGRAAALITLGLSSVLASSGVTELINCRGCGAPAPAGAVYCARCGLSLIEDD